MPSKSQCDGGLETGPFKHRNLAPITKWGWKFMNEPHSFWRKAIVSTSFDWHTVGKHGLSLRSPWISISKI